jgi:AcrR family transcriptional regulator
MDQKLDGRSARRDRNSEAVLDAVHELFVQGNFAPAVEDVAARSGVSLRSVYRYFEDADVLLRSAIERRVALVEPLFVLPDIGQGPLEERITRLVNHRLVLHDKLGPSVRAALLRAPHSPILAEHVRRRRQMLSQQVEQQFAPEAQALGKRRGMDLVACADALCEFEALEHLRFHRGLSVARTRSTLVTGLKALFGPSDR